LAGRPLTRWPSLRAHPRGGRGGKPSPQGPGGEEASGPRVHTSRPVDGRTATDDREARGASGRRSPAPRGVVRGPHVKRGLEERDPRSSGGENGPRPRHRRRHDGGVEPRSLLGRNRQKMDTIGHLRAPRGRFWSEQCGRNTAAERVGIPQHPQCVRTELAVRQEGRGYRTGPPSRRQPVASRHGLRGGAEARHSFVGGAARDGAGRRTRARQPRASSKARCRSPVAGKSAGRPKGSCAKLQRGSAMFVSGLRQARGAASEMNSRAKGRVRRRSRTELPLRVDASRGFSIVAACHSGNMPDSPVPVG